MKRLLCLFGVLVLVVGCSKEEVDDGAILSVSKDGEGLISILIWKGKIFIWRLI